MKGKTSLVLMEQLIMVLVFSLAAAICLQAFAKAGGICAETARRDEASIIAQNAAELLQATGGDAEIAGHLSGSGYRLEIREQDGEIPGLGQAEIRVYYGDTLLVSLRTGWQEELP